MKKFAILIASAAFVVSGAALADDNGYPVKGGGDVQGQQMQQGIQLDIDIAGDEAPVTRDSTSSNIRYSGEYDLNNVPNVTAPGLTTTLTETCMGSTSAGAAASGWGVSFGTTWRDSACVRRLDARELASLGYKLGAKERMCDDDKNRAALLRAGTPCRNDIPELAPVEAAPRAIIAPPAEETPALGSNSDERDVWAFSSMGG
jgi:hypothetical protein